MAGRTGDRAVEYQCRAPADDGPLIAHPTTQEKRIMKRLTWGFLALVCVYSLLVGGCSLDKGSTGPSAVELGTPVSPGSQLYTLVGSQFLGTLTANVGGTSGTLGILFTSEGGTAVTATVTFNDGQGYVGDAVGTLSNLHTLARNGLSGGGCTAWESQGTVTLAVPPARDTYTGSYYATCHNSPSAVFGDSGTFALSRTGTLGLPIPPPPVIVDVCPNLEGTQLVVPAGYVLTNGQCVLIPPPPPPPLLCSTSYWRMNNGNTNAKQNKCVNNGGTWLGEFDVPGSAAGIEHDVCKFQPNPPGAPGNDETLITPPGLTPIACPIS